MRRCIRKAMSKYETADVVEQPHSTELTHFTSNIRIHESKWLILLNNVGTFVNNTQILVNTEIGIYRKKNFEQISDFNF